MKNLFRQTLILAVFPIFLAGLLVGCGGGGGGSSAPSSSTLVTGTVVQGSAVVGATVT